MPIDWDQFEREVDDALERAESRTDDRLASRASSLTELTDEEVLRLFPETADLKRLATLKRIVQSAGDRNMKVARLQENIEHLGGTVMTLLERFL